MPDLDDVNCVDINLRSRRDEAHPIAVDDDLARVSRVDDERGEANGEPAPADDQQRH
jgi:hypothetical protein